jgi:hypothetical protein
MNLEAKVSNKGQQYLRNFTKHYNYLVISLYDNY